MINHNTLRICYRSRYFGGFSANATVHSFVQSGNVGGAVLASRCIQGVVPILHGSAGCALHYRDLIRGNNYFLEDLICTDMAESDYIMGGSEKLRKTILETWERFHPYMILVIPADPIQVTTDEIQTVLDELAPVVSCRLLYARIRTISQPYSRWFSGRELDLTDEEWEKIRAEELDLTEYQLEKRDFGCGFVDVYKQLIGELLKPQDKDEKLLVMGGFPSAGRSWGIFDYAESELKEFGFRILHLNRTVAPEDFAKASAAAYSYGFPRGSAYFLKRKFGVDVFPEEIWKYRNDGLDGIEKFYLDLIHLFHLGAEAEEKIRTKKEETIQRLQKENAVVEGASCAFCVDTPSVIAWVMKLLKKCLGVRVKYILMTTEDKTYFDLEHAEKDIETLTRRNMKLAVEELGYEPVLIHEPTPEQIYQVADEVDYFIGGDHFPAIHEAKRGVTDIPSTGHLYFDDFAEYMISYVKSLRENNYNYTRYLLKDRMYLEKDWNTSISARMSFHTRK